MEHLPLATTFIVRVTEKDGGQLTGTVERARTGERRRFLGVEHIGEVIVEMAATTPPPDATVTEPSGPAKDGEGERAMSPAFVAAGIPPILTWLNWRETIQAVADVRRETRAWARHFTGEGHATVSRNRRGMSAELAGVGRSPAVMDGTTF